MSNSTAIFRSDLQEKVLREIALDPSERTATDIARTLGAPISTVSRETDRLVKAGLLTERREGRKRLLTPCWRNPFMRAVHQAFEFQRTVDDMEDHPERWHTWTSQIARAMGDELRAGNEAMALRIMLDGVNQIPLAHALGVLEEMLDEPDTTGSERWDTLLATCVRYRCRKLGVKAPAWTRKEPLASWWWPAREHARAAMTVQRTPIDFKRLGIWFDERNFETA